MPIPLFTNNAATALAVAITPTDTVLQVVAGTGQQFPSPTGGNYFMLTLIQINNPEVGEIVKCTYRNGDFLTVERGQENTQPQIFNISDNVQLRITAQSLNLFAAGGGGGGGAAATQEVSFIATQGQTVFTIPFTYLPDQNNLAVFVNGSKQVVDTNYSESSSTSITFFTGLNAGDIVEVVYGLPVASGQLNASNIYYEEPGTGSIQRTVQDKISELPSAADFATTAEFNTYANSLTHPINFAIEPQNTVRTLTSKLQESVSVLDFGAVADGSGISGTDNTAAFQNALNSGALKITVPSGSYLIDTIVIPSNVTLDLTGATLLMKPHTTSHNPMIRMGTASSAITNSTIIGGTLNGNKSSQTYSGEEFSPGVMLWGSSFCKIIGTSITNCAGDGITIGYDTGRVVGSDHNTIKDCYIYNNLSGRQAIAISYGSENSIINNKINGNIDLEADTLVGEVKNNLIDGNTGEVSSAFTSTSNAVPRTSNLSISLSTLNTNPGTTQGNIVTNNICYLITAGVSDSTIISNNQIIGSTTGATYLQLLDLFGANNTVVSNNIFIQNYMLPTTSLTSIIRTRGCDNLTVTGNTCPDLNGIVFHNFVASTAIASNVVATSSAGYILMQCKNISNPSNLTDAPSTGTPIQFTTTGTLPTGLTAGQTYYAYLANPNTEAFYIATSLAYALNGTGPYVAYTNAGTGTHTLQYVAQPNSHTFKDNTIPSTATYRNGALNPSEWARFQINQISGGTLSAVQIAGVPTNINVSRSGTALLVSPVDSNEIYQLLPQCNATTANTQTMTQNLNYTVSYSGNNALFQVYTLTPSAGAVSLSAFSFASAGGSGTFFMDIWY